MFLIDGQLRWGAADLALHARCEFALLRSIDETLGRAAATPSERDAWQTHMGTMRRQHERDVVAALAARGTTVVDGPPSADVALASLDSAALEAAQRATRGALNVGAGQVLHRPLLVAGDFTDRADLLIGPRRRAGSWTVAEPRLNFSLKRSSSLRLATTALALGEMGIRVSAFAQQHLPHEDVHVIEWAVAASGVVEQRERLREVLASHPRRGPVAWGEPGVRACGWCRRCRAEVVAHDDVRLVAGLKGEARELMRAAGIGTVQALAEAVAAPEGLDEPEFERLRLQASLQNAQRLAGPEAPLQYQLAPGSERAWRMLPAPDAGDLFFDFEGDPFYDEGPGRRGLQYLWGWEDAHGEYSAHWAHDFDAERRTFEWFVDMLHERLALHPGLHVFHYASYETDALREMAESYDTRREELADLIARGVFVDLYAIVRAGVLVSSGSYSIKRIEPLYLGQGQRDSHEVQAGDASIVVYHDWRTANADPVREGEAVTLLGDLAAYNAHDCLSTRGLRDWLLERAAEHRRSVAAESVPG